MHRGIVSVFGGSAPQPDTPAYTSAYQVGRLLAEAGYAVATGGYTGVMEAASKGAAEVGGHVIGVTTDALNRWESRAVQPNAWVKEEIKFPTLRDRLYHLVSFCDAAVILPGGIGTLGEFSLAWGLIQVGEIPTKPLILLGETWDTTLKMFYGSGEYIRQEDMALFQCVHAPEAIVPALNGLNGRFTG
jgi:uncharacterized protein (TIGR00730 family)